MSRIRIATRNSPLAMWQAEFVMQQLLEVHTDLSVEIVGMTTAGDQMLDRSLSKAGGKGLFLKELERSVLSGETDIAVHSMKDVPIALPDGLEIAVVCAREDARDVVVSNSYQNLYALPKGAKVGTSSMRRIAQLKSAFPSLEFTELRGNVNSRLAKLDSGDYDAIILAAAGLIRLGLKNRISQYITPELCLPAVGQGIIGIECRSSDERTRDLLEPLHSPESSLYLSAERAMNAALGGGCHVPVAGFAEVNKGKIRMRGMVGEVDGSRCIFGIRTSAAMSEKAADALGRQVAEDLLEQGAREILDSVYHASVQNEQPEKAVVVLTRQERYLGNLKEIIESFDYQGVHVPTLEIEPNNDPVTLTPLSKLSEYTDLIFVSRNAVEQGMAVIQSKGALPDDVRVMAVGAETAKQLYKTYGVDAMFPDHGVGAEALLRVKKLADLRGRRILIVRGDIGLDWPAEEMRNRGAIVEQVEVYRQEPHAELIHRVETLCSSGRKVAAVFLHSPQSAANLMQALRPHLPKLNETMLVAGSQRIARTALEGGWEGKLRVARSPSNKHMLMSLLN
ncbi:MAG: hydroxymethylbilane synthase [Gammaproteobacteria bacterium]|nr:hydroxymethylbilane synthase [Gammaproteobacteria bacterium]